MRAVLGIAGFTGIKVSFFLLDVSAAGSVNDRCRHPSRWEGSA